MDKAKTLLILICFLSLGLNVIKHNSSPPAFNADEAAQGYNAYSISQTGRDEYGFFLPLRLKSFGDYKLPLYSYLSVPFVGVMGLSETSTRMLNTVLSLLFPAVIYFLSIELFKNKKIGLFAAFLTSTSLGLHLVGRQAHEAYLAAFFISLSLIFLIRFINKHRKKDAIIFSIFTLASLFSYQSSRIFAIAFILIMLTSLIRLKKGWVGLILAVLVFAVFSLTDVIYNPARVERLLITNSSGFNMKLAELRREGGSFLLYNKPFLAVRDVLYQHINYYSPQFLVEEGDENPRFGFSRMSPLSLIEYGFLFIGLFYLFRNKEKFRYLIVFILVITPFSASISWAGLSITRSLFILIPILLVASYGMFNLFKNKRSYLLIGLLFANIILLLYSWDFYLNHYPKRALVARSWQVGYRELVSYVSTNYNKFNEIYITNKHGQPYIFYLFYTKYNPSDYQKKAQLSAPDQYGFGQVKALDKLQFEFPFNKDKKGVVWIGYPDDYQFLENTIDFSKFKKIKFDNEDIFWIHETN